MNATKMDRLSPPPPGGEQEQAIVGSRRMKRVAIYLRVSTDKQTTNNQRRELEAGLIEVDTQPGEFTEFKVILPRMAATSKAGADK